MIRLDRRLHRNDRQKHYVKGGKRDSEIRRDVGQTFTLPGTHNFDEVGGLHLSIMGLYFFIFSYFSLCTHIRFQVENSSEVELMRLWGASKLPLARPCGKVMED